MTNTILTSDTGDAIVDRILSRIVSSALEADRKASEACMKSKYSVQDYWLCMEFTLQQLHDDIARDCGCDARCPHGPFRQRVSEFRQRELKLLNEVQ